MKLNLDFALYKGKTRLRDWWKQVKAHFIEVQDAINELDDTNGELAQAISDEAAERERVDGVLWDNIADAAAEIAKETKARQSADDILNTALFGEESIYTVSATYAYDSALETFMKQTIDIQADTTFCGFVIWLMNPETSETVGEISSDNLRDGWTVDWGLTLANTETSRNIYMYLDITQRKVWFGTYWSFESDEGFRIGACGGDDSGYWLEWTQPSGQTLSLQSTRMKLSDLATENKSSFASAINELANREIAVDGTLSDTSKNPVQNRVVKEAIDELRESAAGGMTGTLATEEMIEQIVTNPSFVEIPTDKITIGLATDQDIDEMF